MEKQKGEEGVGAAGGSWKQVIRVETGSKHNPKSWVGKGNPKGFLYGEITNMKDKFYHLKKINKHPFKFFSRITISMLDYVVQNMWK